MSLKEVFWLVSSSLKAHNKQPDAVSLDLLWLIKCMPPDTMTGNQIHAEKNMLHSWQGWLYGRKYVLRCLMLYTNTMNYTLSYLTDFIL